MCVRGGPFEELHEQADVEDPPQDEKQAVPQADAGVERREVQVVVVTDSSDHCGSKAFVLNWCFKSTRRLFASPVEFRTERKRSLVVRLKPRGLEGDRRSLIDVQLIDTHKLD